MTTTNRSRLRHSLITIAALMSLTLPLRTVTAQPADASTPSRIAPEDYESSTVTKRYGGQLLIADAISLGVMVAAVQIDDDPTGIAIASLGAASYSITPIILHKRHDNGKVIAGSLALRIGLPSIGALAGAAVGYGQCEVTPCLTEPINGMMVGVLIGAVTASVADAAVFAKHTRVVKTPRTFNIAPVVAPSKGGAMVGFVGEW